MQKEERKYSEKKNKRIENHALLGICEAVMAWGGLIERGPIIPGNPSEMWLKLGVSKYKEGGLSVEYLTGWFRPTLIPVSSIIWNIYW